MIQDIGVKSVYKLSPKHLTQLHELYTEEWWTKERTLEETRQVVAHSTVVVGLVNAQGDLVAFARVLSDRIFKAFLFDVIVAAPYRDQGLGRELMEAVLHHESLQEVKNFELYCLPEMADFYRQYGFTDDVGAITFMRKGEWP